MNEQKIVVELVDVTDEALPGEAEAGDAYEAVPCYCPFCEADVVSERKRCPRCGAPMWGHFTIETQRLPWP